MSEYDAEYQGLIKEHSDLVNIVSNMMDVERDMRDNVTIKLLMARAKDMLDIAINEICEVSPADTVEITRVIVNIKTAVYLKRALELILAKGLAAERKLRAMSEAQSYSVGDEN